MEFLEFIFPGFWDGELLGDRSEKSVNSTATSDVFRIGKLFTCFPWPILVVPGSMVSVDGLRGDRIGRSRPRLV